MDKTLKIFMTIEAIPDISQRQLAKRTSFSLGTVNGILQKLIDNGEIISKMVTPNHYIYEITDKGAVHKAKLLYDFTLEGYDAIGRIRSNCKKAIDSAIEEGIGFFYLYGQDDPIYKLVKMSLIEVKRHAAIDYCYIDNFEQITNERPFKVLMWNKETLDINGDTINVLVG